MQSSCFVDLLICCSFIVSASFTWVKIMFFLKAMQPILIKIKCKYDSEDWVGVLYWKEHCAKGGLILVYFISFKELFKEYLVIDRLLADFFLVFIKQS